MPTVLIRDPLTANELQGLTQEFPQFDYRVELPQSPLSEEEWGEVEVVYGHFIQQEELQHAHRLRWIHVPIASLNDLCLQEIKTTTNIFITSTKDPDTHQTTEYAVGAILSFAKHLFDFHESRQAIQKGRESPFRDLIWSLQGRTHLQIGLGARGTPIAAACEQFGMKVWGVETPPSFHPNCKKVFPYSALHSILSAADVICVSVRHSHLSHPLLERAQLDLMQADAILVVLGGTGLVDLTALEQVAGKFRGIALDASPSKETSALMNHHNVLITPEISELPQEAQRLNYRIFLHNFRRFLHNDFPSMRGITNPTC